MIGDATIIAIGNQVMNLLRSYRDDLNYANDKIDEGKVFNIGFKASIKTDGDQNEIKTTIKFIKDKVSDSIEEFSSEEDKKPELKKVKG